MHRHRDGCQPSGVEERTAPELGDIARQFYTQLCKSQRLSREQHRAISDIMLCRTAQLGGHVDVCPQCGHKQPSYNSCLNRHCPKCQWLASERWLDERKKYLLPTHHFHVVFTVPAELRVLFRYNAKLLYGLLFQSATSALLELARDKKRLNAQLGITAVLHSWTRDLRLHPHLHCLVTGGGLTADGKFRSTKVGFLFPAKVLGKLFQGKFLDALNKLYHQKQLRLDGPCENLVSRDAFAKLLDKLYRNKWRPYTKKPFASVMSVCQYLARYTHRTAISNRRLLCFDQQRVVFRTRGDKTTSLSPLCFLRRFLQHVLPYRFVRIRHYGLYASGNLNTKLVQARLLLEQNPVADSPHDANKDKTVDADSEQPDFVTRLIRAFGFDPMKCPVCGSRLLPLQTIARYRYLSPNRSPPEVS